MCGYLEMCIQLGRIEWFKIGSTSVLRERIEKREEDVCLLYHDSLESIKKVNN